MDEAERGECQCGNETFQSDANAGEDAHPNILQLRDLASIDPQAAERGEKENRREKEEAPVGVEPTNGGFANRCLSHLATAPTLPQIKECLPSGQEDLRRPGKKPDSNSWLARTIGIRP